MGLGLSGFPPILGEVQVWGGGGGLAFFGWVGGWVGGWVAELLFQWNSSMQFVCLWQALFVHEKTILPSGSPLQGR